MMNWPTLFFLPPDSSAPDAVVAPLWLLGTVFLFAAAWRWARRLFPRDPYLELIGHTLVLWWAGIAAVALALGGTGCLNGPSLLLGVATLSLSGLALGRLRSAGPSPGPVPCNRAERGWLILWGALLGYWVAHVVTTGLGKVPSEWDSLAYHIPLVDHWLQHHSLASADCARWVNPGNNELLALWAVAPFSGDFLISLNNFPAAVLLASSAVSCAARIGLPRPLAHLAGLALVCNSPVLSQLTTAANDVAVEAAFFASLSYALRYGEKEERGSLILGALSLGLLAGVKYYALGYAALAFAVWVVLAALAHGPRSAGCVLFAGTAGVLVLGSYWYVRNWLLTGSPLYPKEFFKHPDVLSQFYPDVTRSSFFGNRRPELLRLYVRAVWKQIGPCQLTGFLLLPLSLVWSLVSAGWHARGGRDPALARAHSALALLLVGTGLLLGMTPFAVEDSPGTLNQMHMTHTPVRYGLCFLGTATLAALILLRSVFIERRGTPQQAANGRTRPWRRLWLTGLRLLTGLALAGAAVFQLDHASRRLHIDRVENVLIAGSLVWAGLILILLATRWPRLIILLLLVTALPAWAGTCALLSGVWHREFIHHYDSMSGFEGLHDIDQDGESSHTVLVLQQRCYPFFGSRRQHRVYQPVYVPSPEWIVEFLRKQDVAFISAGAETPPPGMRRFLGFDACRSRHPDMFGVVREGGEYTIVKVLHSSEQSVRRTSKEH